jgi:hypothetical protein
MKITRDLQRDGNLAPAVWNVLCTLPEACLHHELHRLRHPKSIYRATLKGLAIDLALLAEEYDRSWLGHFLGSQTDLNVLLEAHQKLLFSLHDHFDASASILRALSPTQRSTTFDSQYLDQVRLPGWTPYRQAMRAYAGEHVGTIVNRIKHRGAHLEWLWLESDNDFRPGYFLSGVLKGGVLGPDPAVHPGGNSAISIAREMLCATWWIYRHGQLLDNAISSALPPLGMPAPNQPAAFDASQELEAALALVSKARVKVLPNEIRLPCPRICLDTSSTRLTLDMPGITPSRLLPGRYRIKGSMAGIDDQHRTYKLPYMGEDAEP